MNGEKCQGKNEQDFHDSEQDFHDSEQDLHDFQDFTGLGLWCAGAVVACHGVFDASETRILLNPGNLGNPAPNRDNLGNPASDDWHGEGQALALR